MAKKKIKVKNKQKQKQKQTVNVNVHIDQSKSTRPARRVRQKEQQPHSQYMPIHIPQFMPQYNPAQQNLGIYPSEQHPLKDMGIQAHRPYTLEVEKQPPIHDYMGVQPGATPKLKSMGINNIPNINTTPVKPDGGFDALLEEVPMNEEVLPNNMGFDNSLLQIPEVKSNGNLGLELKTPIKQKNDDEPEPRQFLRPRSDSDSTTIGDRDSNLSSLAFTGIPPNFPRALFTSIDGNVENILSNGKKLNKDVWISVLKKYIRKEFGVSGDSWISQQKKENGQSYSISRLEDLYALARIATSHANTPNGKAK